MARKTVRERAERDIVRVPRPAKQRQVTPRQAARGIGRAAGKITIRQHRYTAGHVLLAELLAACGIIMIRAVADYEPQADGTLKGKIGHPKGQLGPLPVFASVLIVFWLLSFLAVRGGSRAKVAVAGGLLIDLVLVMRSLGEFEKVAGTFGTLGKAVTVKANASPNISAGGKGNPSVQAT